MEKLDKKISDYFQESKQLSKEKLLNSIKGDFPNWAENTINMYLSKLKKNGNISTPSRGIYELGSSPQFAPQISKNLERIYKNINKQYPFVTFCVWDTIWLNDLILHQPFKHYVVVEVEKDAVEAVFNFLNASEKNTFLSPNEEMFSRYIEPLHDVIIVKNLITESPVKEINGVKIPTLEKLLVDMLTDVELFSAQQGEKAIIVKSAKDKYLLNESKMRRYGFRRNREKEVGELLNITLAN